MPELLDALAAAREDADGTRLVRRRRERPRSALEPGRGDGVLPTRDAPLHSLEASVELAGEVLAARLPDVPTASRARVRNGASVGETA